MVKDSQFRDCRLTLDNPLDVCPISRIDFTFIIKPPSELLLNVNLLKPLWRAGLEQRCLESGQVIHLLMGEHRYMVWIRCKSPLHTGLVGNTCRVGDGKKRTNFI